ncbi:unnamed protein product [Fasciola hepatica]|uniref:Uncharacterized protein n=1 Tax=Fasciola hepatica TaxID=6192 RepID=A0ABC9HFT4_FASHE
MQVIPILYRKPHGGRSSHQECVDNALPQLLITGDFSAHEVGWTSETGAEGTFGEGLLYLIHRKALV